MTSTAKMTRKELNALLRSDFHTFFSRVFLDLHGGTAFLPNWHLEVMAARLQAVAEGRISRLVISLPPRASRRSTRVSKSVQCNVATSAAATSSASSRA